jgi:AcrR family transcriptional regulator
MSAAVIALTVTVVNYHWPMARWEPDARGRLEQASMELYADRGFENTTVAEIAERAGLTERTFFRHYADKREALFGGAGELQDALVSAVSEVPVSVAPLDAVATGLESVGSWLEEQRGREYASRRQRIINANTELQERELIKFASLSAALADILRKRGTGEPAASLTAEVGIAAFKVAFERWIHRSNRRNLPELISDSLDELRAVAVSR